VESVIVSAPEGIIGAPSICVRDTCAELKPGALKPESAAAAAAAVTGTSFQSQSQKKVLNLCLMSAAAEFIVDLS
jgi:hypothetical protein